MAWRITGTVWPFQAAYLSITLSKSLIQDPMALTMYARLQSYLSSHQVLRHLAAVRVTALPLSMIVHLSLTIPLVKVFTFSVLISGPVLQIYLVVKYLYRQHNRSSK